MNGIKILGHGRYIPEKVVTNDDLKQYMDTSDEWIRERTGIKERHFADEGMRNYEMAAKAAAQAIERAGIDKEKIAFLVTSTFTPDFPTPSVACMVQTELGIPDTCGCFDVNGACSGFIYGLHVMRGLLIQEHEKKGEDAEIYGVCIGSEVISRKMDLSDRESSILFGDGSGAVVVKIDKNAPYEHILGARGNFDVLSCEGYEKDIPAHINMKGKDVFRFAVTAIPKCIDDILENQNLTMDDIDHVVCHQANARIIEMVRKKYKAPEEKFYMNIDRIGNTSAASVPIVLSEMLEKGILKKGDKAICVGFGAGLTWAGVLIEI